MMNLGHNILLNLANNLAAGIVLQKEKVETKLTLNINVLDLNGETPGTFSELNPMTHRSRFNF